MFFVSFSWNLYYLKAKFGKIKAQANTGSILTDKRGCQTVKVRATELYYIRATFPPLRHSFIQRHHCIHTLINHVYTKDQDLCYSLPHDTMDKESRQFIWSDYT